MLENPYFAASSSLSDDPGVYRGEGRIEEAEDGSSISIWWESTLAEAMELNLRLQKKLGIWKTVRRSQVILLLCGAFLLIVAFFLQEDEEEVVQWICILSGLFFVAVAIFRPIRFKQSLKKIVIQARGGNGVIEARVQIDPVGVRTIAVDTETVFYWRSIQEIEVSNIGVTFVRQLAGLAHVPTRVFSDADAMDRFVRLGQKYLKAKID